MGLSIEDVEDYFKNAEEVVCLSSGNKIQLKYMTSRGIHTFSNKYWIDFENHPNLHTPNNSCLLWSENKGCAEISKTKSNLEPNYEIY